MGLAIDRLARLLAAAKSGGDKLQRVQYNGDTVVAGGRTVPAEVVADIAPAVGDFVYAVVSDGRAVVVGK